MLIILIYYWFTKIKKNDKFNNIKFVKYKNLARKFTIDGIRS